MTTRKFKLGVTQGEGSDIDPIPAAVYVGTCFAIYDLGHQEDFFNEGQFKHQVMLMWEIPDVRIEIEKDGKKIDMPRAVMKTYTLSIDSRSNLYKDLVAWRGKDFSKEEMERFELGNIIGACCQIQVGIKTSKKGNPYNEVLNIMAMSKGMKKPEMENPEKGFSFEMVAEHGLDLIKDVPKGIAAKIVKSTEWKQLAAADAQLKAEAQQTFPVPEDIPEEIYEEPPTQGEINELCNETMGYTEADDEDMLF